MSAIAKYTYQIFPGDIPVDVGHGIVALAKEATMNCPICRNTGNQHVEQHEDQPIQFYCHICNILWTPGNTYLFLAKPQ